VPPFGPKTAAAIAALCALAALDAAHAQEIVLGGPLAGAPVLVPVPATRASRVELVAGSGPGLTGGTGMTETGAVGGSFAFGFAARWIMSQDPACDCGAGVTLGYTQEGMPPRTLVSAPARSFDGGVVLEWPIEWLGDGDQYLVVPLVIGAALRTTVNDELLGPRLASGFDIHFGGAERAMPIAGVGLDARLPVSFDGNWGYTVSFDMHVGLDVPVVAP
jgi:hypothetical protein